MKIHETYDANGVLSEVFVTCEGARLLLVEQRGTFVVPDGAMDAVMKKFGAALDPDASVMEVATLDLPDGARLRHVRHRATFDVIARDYLVYERPDAPASFALATTVAGALAHLALM